MVCVGYGVGFVVGVLDFVCVGVRGHGMVSFVVIWCGFLARVVGLCMMVVGGCVCWSRFLSLVVVWVWIWYLRLLEFVGLRSICWLVVGLGAIVLLVGVIACGVRWFGFGCVV